MIYDNVFGEIKRYTDTLSVGPFFPIDHCWHCSELNMLTTDPHSERQLAYGVGTFVCCKPVLVWMNDRKRASGWFPKRKNADGIYVYVGGSWHRYVPTPLEPWQRDDDV